MAQQLACLKSQVTRLFDAPTVQGFLDYIDFMTLDRLIDRAI